MLSWGTALQGKVVWGQVAPATTMGSQQRAAAAALLLPLLLCSIAQQANSAEPLRMAIVNQVHFHLEVVAGAMHILKTLTSAPVTVYLPAKVMKTNWYGFRSWLGDKEGFIWKDCKEYDGTTTYDFVWFITPERDTSWVASVAEQMKPKLALYYVHNGHIPDADLKAIKELSGKMPLLTLSPHVSKNISEKAAPIEPVWVLPIFPYQPASTCTLQDLQVCPSSQHNPPEQCHLHVVYCMCPVLLCNSSGCGQQCWSTCMETQPLQQPAHMQGTRRDQLDLPGRSSGTHAGSKSATAAGSRISSKMYRCTPVHACN